MRASSGGPTGRRGTGCRTWQCAVQPTGPVVFAQLGLTSRAAWPARTPLPRARQARSSSHPRSLGALRHRRGRRTRAVPPSRERHSVPPAWAASVTGHPRRTIRSSEAESGRERPQSQPARTSVCTEATTGETSRRLCAPGSSSCGEDVGAQHGLLAGEYRARLVEQRVLEEHGGPGAWCDDDCARTEVSCSDDAVRLRSSSARGLRRR